MTAVSAQLLLIGPDAWPFDDDRQAKLIAAIKGDLMYSTGRFPDPLKYQVTDVRSSSGASAPPGRKLLQARVALVLLLTRSPSSVGACSEATEQPCFSFRGPHRESGHALHSACV